MSDLDEALERLAAGETSEDDQEALRRLLSAESGRARAVDALMFGITLRDVLLTVEDSRQLVAEQNPRRHRPRSSRQRTARRQRRSWVTLTAVSTAAAAACALLAIGLYSLGTRSQSSHTAPGRGPKPETTAMEARPASEPTEAAAAAARQPAPESDGPSVDRAASARAEDTGTGLRAPVARPSRVVAHQVPRPPADGGAVDKVAASERGHVAYLDSPVGNVELRRSNSQTWTTARAGIALSQGDRLRTKFSRARVSFASRSVLYVDRFTTLAMGEQAGAPGLSMVGGEVYVETVPTDKGFWVETPHGKSVDLGTRFGVDVELRGTTVVVAEGKVIVENEKGRSEAEAGFQVRVRKGSKPGQPRKANVARLLAWTRWLGGRPAAIGTSEGLIADWRFDEGVGLVASDSSGSHNDGVIRGARWTAGKIGHALEFDGTDDYVTAADQGAFRTSDATWSLWFKLHGVSGDPDFQTLIAKDTENRRSHDLDLLWDSKLSRLTVRYQSPETETVWISQDAATGTIRPGEWHHAAVVVASGEKGSISLYLDGALQEVTSGTYGGVKTTAPLAVGGGFGGSTEPSSSSFNGVIDEIRFYDRALDAHEIRRLAMKGESR